MRLTPVTRAKRFFELFNKQGDIVSETLTELSKSLLEGKSRHARLRDLEHACDDATHEIHNLVNNTFATPLDQGDILLLASSLDDIVDLGEETADKVDLYRVQSITDAAKEMGEYLAKARCHPQARKRERPHAAGRDRRPVLGCQGCLRAPQMEGHL